MITERQHRPIASPRCNYCREGDGFVPRIRERQDTDAKNAGSFKGGAGRMSESNYLMVDYVHIVCCEIFRVTHDRITSHFLITGCALKIYTERLFADNGVFPWR